MPHTPASFRVYTAAELRAMPLRQSYRPGAAPATSSKIAGVPMAAAWAGGGLLLTALALGLALVAGRASEDPRDPTRASATVLELPSDPPPAAAIAPAATALDPPPNDFELPDDPAQAKPARKGRLHSRAPRSASATQ